MLYDLQVYRAFSINSAYLSTIYKTLGSHSHDSCHDTSFLTTFTKLNRIHCIECNEIGIGVNSNKGITIGAVIGRNPSMVIPLIANQDLTPTLKRLGLSPYPLPFTTNPFQFALTISSIMEANDTSSNHLNILNPHTPEWNYLYL